MVEHAAGWEKTCQHGMRAAQDVEGLPCLSANGALIDAVFVACGHFFGIVLAKTEARMVPCCKLLEALQASSSAAKGKVCDLAIANGVRYLPRHIVSAVVVLCRSTRTLIKALTASVPRCQTQSQLGLHMETEFCHLQMPQPYQMSDMSNSVEG